MKLFIAALLTETNMFSPFPTGNSDFENNHIIHGNGKDVELSNYGESLEQVRQLAKKNAWEISCSLCASAQPAGFTVKSVFESFRNEILEDLKAALPIDAIFLHLHGAMAAYGYDDCEGDLLFEIRNIAGPDVAIGTLLDPHSHLSSKMIESATIISCYHKYPHTDVGERGLHLFEILSETAQGKIAPQMSVVDCRMLSGYYTNIEPMLSFVSDMKNALLDKEILDISLVHGFPWADSRDVGSKMIVVSDNTSDKGEMLAQHFADKLFTIRGKTMPQPLALEQAIEYAKNINLGPVVMSDWTDVAGGGAPSDSTYFLQAILDANLENVALAFIFDPQAVQIIHTAGVGTKLKIRIGGKMCWASGNPIDLDVEVIHITKNYVEHFDNSKSYFGDVARVRINSIDILLSSKREQPRTPDSLIAMGIKPKDKKLIVLKGMHHYQAFYNDLAEEMLSVDSGGLLTSDFKNIPYKKIQQPKWPFVENPFNLDHLE